MPPPYRAAPCKPRELLSQQLGLPSHPRGPTGGLVTSGWAPTRTQNGRWRPILGLQRAFGCSGPSSPGFDRLGRVNLWVSGALVAHTPGQPVPGRMAIAPPRRSTSDLRRCRRWCCRVGCACIPICPCRAVADLAPSRRPATSRAARAPVRLTETPPARHQLSTSSSIPQ